MAIVSRGGRVIDLGQEEQQMAAGAQALGQATQLRQQQEAQRMQQVQDMVQNALSMYGPYAFQMQEGPVIENYLQQLGLSQTQIAEMKRAETATGDQMANWGISTRGREVLEGATAPQMQGGAPAAAAPSQVAGQQQPPSTGQQLSYFDTATSIGETVLQRLGGNPVSVDATLEPTFEAVAESLGLDVGVVRQEAMRPGTMEERNRPLDILNGYSPNQVDWLRQHAIAIASGQTPLTQNPDGSFPMYQAMMNRITDLTPQEMAVGGGDILPPTPSTPSTLDQSVRDQEGEFRREMDRGVTATPPTQARIQELEEQERVLREQIAQGTASEGWQEEFNRIESERIDIDPGYTPTGLPIPGTGASRDEAAARAREVSNATIQNQLGFSVDDENNIYVRQPQGEVPTAGERAQARQDTQRVTRSTASFTVNEEKIEQRARSLAERDLPVPAMAAQGRQIAEEERSNRYQYLNEIRQVTGTMPVTEEYISDTRTMAASIVDSIQANPELFPIATQRMAQGQASQLEIQRRRLEVQKMNMDVQVQRSILFGADGASRIQEVADAEFDRMGLQNEYLRAQLNHLMSQEEFLRLQMAFVEQEDPQEMSPSDVERMATNARTLLESISTQMTRRQEAGGSSQPSDHINALVNLWNVNYGGAYGFFLEFDPGSDAWIPLFRGSQNISIRSLDEVFNLLDPGASSGPDSNVDLDAFLSSLNQ